MTRAGAQRLYEILEAKRLSRWRDAHALATGQKSRDQLRRENHFLPAERALVDIRRSPKPR